MNAFWQRVVGLVLALAVGFSAAVPAQEQRTFSQQDLDRMLAPVALYPDALLSQVLMASTYPLEVVQAARWVQANPGLRGEALEQALAEQDWDPSVKALVPFPQVLEMMSERLDWTQRLGDAVLVQQDQVMATVQQLRRKAHEAGNLTTTRQQTVVVEPEVIVIEPADPEVVYVPVYNPTVVYGGWWWPAAPYVWYPRTYVVGSGLVAGVTFGLGVAVGNYLWGGFDWHHHKIHVYRDVDVVRNVTVNRHINIRRDRGARERVPYWEHDPSHRRGVRYRDYATRERLAAPAADPGRLDARRDALRQRLRELESPSLRASRGEPRELRSPSSRAGRGEVREPLTPSFRAGRGEAREPLSPSIRAGRGEPREPLSPSLRAGQEPRRAGGARSQTAEPTSRPMLPLAREGRERARSRPEVSAGETATAPMLPLAREGRERSRPRAEPRAAQPASAPMLPFARDDSGRGRQSVAPQARGGTDGGGRPGPGARREGWQPSWGADRGGGRDLARGQSGR